MAYSIKTKGIALSLIHLMLGVLSIVFGTIAIKLKEASYNDGLYGMGIWLGIWMLITCLCGLLVASSQPLNKCKITCFIGFSCYSIVAMMVCCIPIIVGPIAHFSFESKATKEYYKKYGPDIMYHKPKSYFDERNRIGRIGCGIYGTLLSIILLDVLVTAVSCFLWKHAINNNFRTPRRQPRQRVPGTLNARNGQLFIGSVNAGYNHSPSFISPHGVVIQDGFVIPAHLLQPKLPSYTDLYPEGCLAWENQPNTTASTHSSPPPYTETTTSQALMNAGAQSSNGPINDPPSVTSPNELDNTPLSNENRPLSDENRPLSDENRPFSDENRPLSDENAPLSDESPHLSDIGLEDAPVSTMTLAPAMANMPLNHPHSIEEPDGNSPLSDVQLEDVPASTTTTLDPPMPNIILESPPPYEI